MSSVKLLNIPYDVAILCVFLSKSAPSSYAPAADVKTISIILIAHVTRVHSRIPVAFLVPFPDNTHPHPSHMTIGFDSLPCCVRLECFGYLTIQDLGTVAQLNYELSRSVATDHVWKSLYPTTFTRAKDSIPHDIQQLVNRPYRRSCIGWSVSVLQDGSDTWLTGIVLEYRNDRFLVRYDLDDSLVWERETLSSGAWFLAGKLRMRFLSAPSLESPMAKPVDPPACPMEDEIASSTVSTKQRKRRRIDTTCSESSMYSSSSTASSSCESPSPLSSPRSACIPVCQLPLVEVRTV